jgi:two-component system response regulator GlrR
VLLLDEIGEMPPALQVKLLRVLQEKEIRPLGSSSTIKVNTRVIAATNRDLAKEVEMGRFREDLYYRISVLKIHIAPLRERPEDIPVLVRHFVRRYAMENAVFIKPVSDDQIAQLSTATWNGNVRELQNAVERAVILARDGEISLTDLIDLEAINMQDSVIEHSEATERCGTPASFELPLKHSEAKRVFETCYLKRLLTESRGNVTEAAKLAEKTRVEIYRYLARNNIVPADFRH